MIQQQQVIGKKKNKFIRTLFTYYKQGSSFDTKAASLYSATIHCDDSLWTFAFADLKSGEILAIEQYDSGENDSVKGLVKVLATDGLKNKIQSATKTFFYSISSQFTIIPSVFFHEKDSEVMASSMFDSAKFLDIRTQFIPEIDSHIVFGITKDLYASLISEIGHVEISHHFAVLISTYKLFYAKEKTSSAFIQYHQSKFTLGLFEGNRLVHFNVFDFKSPEDILYYTYYTMEQFDFSASETIIHIGGTTLESSNILTQLQKYTKNIYLLKPNCCPNLEQEKSNALINTIFDVQCG